MNDSLSSIRPATPNDVSRLAEIEIFNYRLNFYPIFQSDEFYFNELQVTSYVQDFLNAPERLSNTYVYDDGAVKGFIRINGQELEKLFVEPVLQGKGIGACLLRFAVTQKHVSTLWALEKNERAIAFYIRHGFRLTDDRKLEDGTEEYLVLLEK